MAKTNLQSNANNLNIDPVLLARAIEYSKAKKRDINTLINISIQRILSGDIDDLDAPLINDIPDNNEKITMDEFLGCFEGQMWMSDDFDEPLDCLKEYMW